MNRKILRRNAKRFMSSAERLFLSGIMPMPPDARIRQAKSLFQKMEEARVALVEMGEPVSKLEDAMMRLDERAGNFAAIHNISWGSS